MSGVTSSRSQANVAPVRPRPDWISSATMSTLLSEQIRLTSRSHPSGGKMTPASPWIGSSRKATVSSSIAVLQCSRIAERDRDEPRRIGAEAVTGSIVG